jgi:hypothetical protein
VFATVPSNGSTNQSDLALDAMVSTFLSSIFQESGAFCQVRLPGRPAIDGAVGPKASARDKTQQQGTTHRFHCT